MVCAVSYDDDSNNYIAVEFSMNARVYFESDALAKQSYSIQRILSMGISAFKGVELLLRTFSIGGRIAAEILKDEYSGITLSHCYFQ